MVTVDQKAARQESKLRKFNQSLPMLYQWFDQEKHPRPQIAQKLFEEWQSNNDEYNDSPFSQIDTPGLILHGPTRTGKTRLACELVKRAIKRSDFMADARFISAVQWGAEASKRAKACELDGWTQSLVDFAWDGYCDPGIILIDDLDKVRVTPTVQSELFNLIETITANELWLVITTQVSGSELAKKFAPEFGSAIVARLREFCVPLDFSKEDA